MWWEPRTDQESRVASAIAQLKSWFGEISSDTAPVAWGFGSTWTADGTLVPLALLNSDRFSTMPPFRLFDRSRITEPLEGTYFPPTLSAPLHVMFVTSPRPSSGALSLQEQMSLVDGVFNDFVRIRERIVGNPQGAPGTAAVLVRDRATGRHGVLTAGHIFPGGQGSRVDRLDTWYYFFWDRRQIGQLIHHEVPVPNAAGWDAAVIELSNAVQPRGRLAARGVERFEEPEAVVVHGAITGFVSDAAVQGALAEIKYDQDGRRWKNCWMMAPSGVLNSGDSGSAVFTRRDARFLGMYVGSSHLRAANKALFHYVQDAFTLEAEVLSRWNINLFG